MGEGFAAAVAAVALAALGGFAAVVKMGAQLAAVTERVSALEKKAVSRDLLDELIRRLDRIEEKLDALREGNRR